MRNSTDEMDDIQGKQDIPKTMDVLQECQDGEMGRDVRKLNRSKRPKLTTVEIARLQNCDRPSDEEAWGEMSIGRQRGGIRNDESTESGAEKRGRWGRKSRWQ